MYTSPLNGKKSLPYVDEADMVTQATRLINAVPNSVPTAVTNTYFEVLQSVEKLLRTPAITCLIIIHNGPTHSSRRRPTVPLSPLHNAII